jgi:shikimate dehydrogenase
MSQHGVPPLAFVIGWPIGHTRSPALHRHWLKRYDIEGQYLPLPIAPEDFESALRILGKCGFVGGNVTIPHKLAAFVIADETTAQAKRLGAANTIIYDAERGIVADNTDGFGFIENLRAARPAWRGEVGPVTVIGAGGASRAIVAALLDAGVPELRLTNRTRAKADAIADELGGQITVVDWAEAESSIEGAALVVNTTSMGMEGGPPLSLTLDALSQDALVTDAVYAPLDTPFLKLARTKGAETVDGLGMLLHQARPGFAAWFGREPEVDDELRAAVLGAPS